jgi:hypothetical protein
MKQAKEQCLNLCIASIDEAYNVTALPKSWAKVTAYIQRELHWGQKLAALAEEHRPGIVLIELPVLSLYELRSLCKADFATTCANLLYNAWFCRFAKLLNTAFTAAILCNYQLPQICSRSAYESLTCAPLLTLYLFAPVT